MTRRAPPRASSRSASPRAAVAPDEQALVLERLYTRRGNPIAPFVALLDAERGGEVAPAWAQTAVEAAAQAAIKRIKERVHKLVTHGRPYPPIRRVFAIGVDAFFPHDADPSETCRADPELCAVLRPGDPRARQGVPHALRQIDDALDQLVVTHEIERVCDGTTGFHKTCEGVADDYRQRGSALSVSTIERYGRASAALVPELFPRVVAAIARARGA